MTGEPLVILFVEDDDDHAEIALRSLARYHVANVMRLPKRDGLEVLRIIKSDERFRRIPVVVLTTSAQESDIQRAYDLNANAYLVKPVDYQKFTDLIRDLGFFWLVWNQAPERRTG